MQLLMSFKLEFLLINIEFQNAQIQYFNDEFFYAATHGNIIQAFSNIGHRFYHKASLKRESNL